MHPSNERPDRSRKLFRAHIVMAPTWLSSAVFALSFAVVAPPSWAQEGPEWSELRTLVEINATDGDAGFQVFLDGDAWVKAKIRDPNGKKIYSVKGKGSVAAQGLTENFFESAEPSCVDDPLDAFLARFPEGAYRFTGKSTENEIFEGEAILTHALPAVPVALDASTMGPNTTVSWKWPSDDTAPAGDPDAAPSLGNCPFPGDADPALEPDILDLETELFGFQVIVGREAPEPLVELVVELAAGARNVVIPQGFIGPNALYKWEVIAIGAGVDPDSPDALDPDLKGNNTIAEDEFCTNNSGNVVDCPE